MIDSLTVKLRTKIRCVSDVIRDNRESLFAVNKNVKIPDIT